MGRPGIPRDDAPGERLTRLPPALEAALFELLFDERFDATHEQLEALCGEHPEHADEIRRVATRLALATGACEDVAMLGERTVQRPSHVGPYRVIRELGKGGFGIVWLAEQTAPLERQVAVKVLLPSLHGEKVLRRFRTERRTLARMRHPGIANILDSGVRQSGEPYFVMEYVPGPPITGFCDAHELDVDARLRLFLQVCSAVQHAHQNGVLHRDLKPGNILVTTPAGTDEPQAKVIDFGLAKALGSELEGRAGVTEEGRFVGTPEYMSPEQARGAHVDTRADVHALGVILHELLTGELPIPADELRAGGWPRALQLLHEREPRSPSQVLSRHADLAAIAARRATSGHELVRRVRGDLGWIVGTALAKEPERRYASVAEMAADVRRHLENRPVSVGPPSLGYAVAKFARRNRAAVLAGACVLALLGLGAVFGAWGVAEVVAASNEAVARERDASHHLYAQRIAVAKAALDLRRARTMRAALADVPATMRGWEWRHLASRSDQSRGVLHAFDTAIEHVVVLDDGATALVSTRGGWPELVGVDVATGHTLFVRRGAGDEVFGLASSFDGTRFAVAYTRPAAVHLHATLTGEPLQWKTDDGSERDAVIPLAGSHATVAFSPRGDRVVVASQDTLRVFDVTSGQEIATPRPMLRSGHSVQDLAFLPDGDHVLSCGHEDGVVLWDLRTGEARSRPMAGHRRHLRRLDVDPAGRHVAAACPVEGVVRIWRIEDGATHRVLRVWSDSMVTDVAYLEGGKRLVSSHDDGSLTFWDVATGEEILSVAGHSGFIASVCAAPGGATVLSASWDGTLRTWDADPAAYEPLVPLGRGVAAFALHPRDGHGFASMLDGRLTSWCLEDGASVWSVALDIRLPHLVVPSPGTRIYAGAGNGRIVVRDTRDGSPVGGGVRPFETGIRQLEASADGCYLAASDGGRVVVLRLPDLAIVTRFEEPLDWRDAMAFVDVEGTPRLATGTDALRIRDVESGALLVDVPLEHQAEALGVDTGSAGLWLTDVAGGIELRGAADGGVVRRLEVGGQQRRAAVPVTTPDGERLLVFEPGSRTVRVLDAERGTELLGLQDHRDWCHDLAFDAVGDRLLGLVGHGEDRRLFVWPSPRGARLPPR